ncbi:MAG: MBL fold metallo-hydrolase [Armatimonadota bacterium]|nr:MBL fold metallo-hydrolase [Armatimonadota bacterium]MDR7389547.1 MBL fold metallo-hydrolase [Armatimonadota bacterium]MDR7392220.1 MBL fold metallo-hydrolase [Armatimonadota bacterium]MDR7393821.1 MBL fold metallo-hydrolase [Armatimonadota bacterium]MDR7397294.1 MBL fold metallo-hydrolase [Armatimonadota bacterium]
MRRLAGLVVLAVGLLVAGQGLSVSAAVRIRYHGHAFFVVTAPDGVRFAIDPYGQIGYPLPEVSADVVLVTHEHRDHNNVGLVRGARAVLRGLTADGRDWNRIRERVGVTTVTSIPSFHDDQGGTSPRGLNTFFLMEMGDLRLAHLGDVGQPALTDAQLRALGRLDVLMIPVGDGPFTIGAAEATRITEQLQPAVVIPMHYKTAARPDWPGTDEGPFLEGKRDVLRTGTTYEVRKDRLPRPTRVVVMAWR